MIDVIEQNLYEFSSVILNYLLFDNTTQKNIVWATDNYINFGNDYLPNKQIFIDLVIGKNTKIIMPRVEKSIKEQQKRTKEKAEVFTPSWVCNLQNNLIDDAWFKRENVFNVSCEKGWITTNDNIEFTERTWKDYIFDLRLEISCGEAPYLVSRYDTVTGVEIPVKDRIGLLDRKFRILNENINNKKEWYEWALNCLKSTYGYDYQGDNVLLARENLLYTFIDNFKFKFNVDPTEEQLIEAAKIISWNVWQMDGLNNTVPFSVEMKEYSQISLFDDCDYKEQTKEMDAKIYDWKEGKSIKFKDLY